MSPSERAPGRPAEFEVEQEVDFGLYLRRLAHAWWLLLAGLVAGALIGVALTLGGGNLYSAKATLYLGQPLSAQGSAQIQSQATNPSSVSRLARADDVLDQASRSSGLPAAKLRAGVSTATVSGYLTKLGQTPLVTVSVKANAPRLEVQNAANEVAGIILDRLSSYPRAKIATLNAEISSYKTEISKINERLDSLNAAIASGSLSPLEQQVLLTAATVSEQRRGTVSDELQSAQLLLAQARTVEQGSFVSHARALKTSAHSRKNGLVVGAALGLLIGAILALSLPRFRRPAA
jgi:hypothetical protein